MTNDEWILALANEIGSRIERGQLPQQDGAGRYQMGSAAADVVAAVANGGTK